VPHPGGGWRPQGHPATRPHQYVRGGPRKIPTLFHPATGRLHLRPVASGTNPVLHGWLKETLSAVVAALPMRAEPVDAAVTRAAWEVWQAGLAERCTLPERLPPLRGLLVRDTLAGHKSAAMVVWLCRHGILPLYTPLGGGWLNMAESSQRVLKRRPLGGQHPRNPGAIGSWFEQTAHAWNRQPAPFLWTGKRRRRRRKRPGDGHPVGGSAARAQRPSSARRSHRQEWQIPSQGTH